MTIIHQQKENRRAKIYIAALFSAFILNSILGIFLYSSNVNYQHDISENKKQVRDLDVKNSELKDQIYELTNVSKMQQVANDSGLVLEKNPQYMKASNDLAMNR